MNKTINATDGKRKRIGREFGWVYEVLALIIVTPALVHGVLSLNNLPIV